MKIIIALLIPAALIGLTRLFRGKSTVALPVGRQLTGKIKT